MAMKYFTHIYLIGSIFVTFATALQLPFVDRIKYRADLILQKIEDSSDCANHLRMLLFDFTKGKKWALQMLDASAKMNSGILRGNLVHVGSYDECMDIEVKPPNSTTIKGQYCNLFAEINYQTYFNEISLHKVLFCGSLMTPEQSAEEFMPHLRDMLYCSLSLQILDFLEVKVPKWPIFEAKKNFNTLIYGVCLPASCSIEYLQTLWDSLEVIVKPGIHISFKDKLCDYRNKPMPHSIIDSKIWAFFMVYLAFLFTCTFYDYFIYRKDEADKNESEPNVFVAFSLYTNVKRLFSPEVDEETLSCIKGIKVLSMWIIIMGHSFVFAILKAPVNLIDIFEWRKKPFNGAVLNAPIAVDTFFTLSGLLLSYMYLLYTSAGLKANLAKFYLGRFARLCAPMFAVILFLIGIFKYMGDGPFWWPSNYMITGNCLRNGFKTMLYVDNFIRYRDSCLPQCWFTAVDGQFYLLSPLVLFSLHKTPRKSMIILSLLSIICMMYSYYITIKKRYGAVLPESSTAEFLSDFYRQPYTRFPEWCIGFAFGYILFNLRNKQLRISKGLVLLLWSLSILVIFSIGLISFFFRDKDYNPHHSAIFNTFGRPIWALSICWVILACATKNGGFINDMLSLPVFCVLEKLNYSVFLTHVPVILYKIIKRRTSHYFGNFDWFYDVCGDIVITYVVAIILSLTFESPTMALSKFFLKKNKQKRAYNRLEKNTNGNIGKKLSKKPKYIVCVIPQDVKLLKKKE